MPAPKIRSKDQNQQQLRDKKQHWNASYKDFSQRLKAFKDGLNGRGNTKLGLPPSNIKEPLPTEIGSFLNQLASEFQSIVGEAGNIITEQQQYARTRRRKNPKTAPQAVQAPIQQQPTQETNPLAILGSQKLLFKEAGKLGRLWQYITSVFSSKKFNKQRVGLLRQAADLYYSLLDFENEILAFGINNIPNVVSTHKKVKYNLATFSGTFEGVVEMIAKSGEAKVVAKEKPAEEHYYQEGEEDKPAEQNAEIEPSTFAQIEHDKHLLFNSNLAKDAIIELNKLMMEYKREPDPQTKSMWLDRVVDFHDQLVRSLIAEAKKKYGANTNIKSVQDIVNLIKKSTKSTMAETVSDYIIKTSHNKFTRYLKRKLVELAPGSRTATVRLETLDIVEEMKNLVKKMMDILQGVSIEGSTSLGELKTHLAAMEEDMLRIKKPLHILNVFFMKDFFSKNEKTKQNKGKKPDLTEDEAMMDYVLKRKLKRELSEDLG
jgi:hypothetical protein